MIPELPIPFNTTIPFFIIPLVFGVVVAILSIVGLLVGFYFSAYFLIIELLFVIIASATVVTALNGGDNILSNGINTGLEALLTRLVTVSDTNVAALISGLLEYVTLIVSELVYYVLFLLGGAILAIVTYLFPLRFFLKRAKLPWTVNRIGGILAGAAIGAGIGSYVILPFSYSSLIVGGDSEAGESFTDNSDILQFLTETIGIQFPALPSQEDLDLILSAATSFLDLGTNIQNLVSDGGEDQSAFIESFFSPQESGFTLEQQLVNSLVLVVDALTFNNDRFLIDIVVGVIEAFGGQLSNEIRIPEFIFQGVLRQVVEQRSQNIPSNIINTFRNIFVTPAAS